MKEKLELKDVVGYLPYGVTLQIGGTIRDLTAVSMDSPFIFVTYWKGSREKEMQNICNAKLVLRPLSAIYNIPEIMDEFSEVSLDVFECAFMGIIKAENRFDFVNVTIMELMFKHHIDIYGLIDAGLAIEFKNEKK